MRKDEAIMALKKGKPVWTEVRGEGWTRVIVGRIVEHLPPDLFRIRPGEGKEDFLCSYHDICLMESKDSSFRKLRGIIKKAFSRLLSLS